MSNVDAHVMTTPRSSFAVDALVGGAAYTLAFAVLDGVQAVDFPMALLVTGGGMVLLCALLAACGAYRHDRQPRATTLMNAAIGSALVVIVVNLLIATTFVPLPVIALAHGLALAGLAIVRMHGLGTAARALVVAGHSIIKARREPVVQVNF